MKGHGPGSCAEPRPTGQRLIASKPRHCTARSTACRGLSACRWYFATSRALLSTRPPGGSAARPAPFAAGSHERADKLRCKLVRRGVVIPAAVLAAALESRSVSASVSPVLSRHRDQDRDRLRGSSGRERGPLRRGDKPGPGGLPYHAPPEAQTYRAHLAAPGSAPPRRFTHSFPGDAGHGGPGGEDCAARRRRASCGDEGRRRDFGPHDRRRPRARPRRQANRRRGRRSGGPAARAVGGRERGRRPVQPAGPRPIQHRRHLPPRGAAHSLDPRFRGVRAGRRRVRSGMGRAEPRRPAARRRPQASRRAAPERPAGRRVGVARRRCRGPRVDGRATHRHGHLRRGQPRGDCPRGPSRLARAGRDQRPGEVHPARPRQRRRPQHLRPRRPRRPTNPPHHSRRRPARQ